MADGGAWQAQAHEPPAIAGPGPRRARRAAAATVDSSCVREAVLVVPALSARFASSSH
jgi:hypothetical protein